MDIVKENVDALNAVIKVKVAKDDYLPQYETAIKNYQRKAAMPGFRPGKVPTGMIKKMYGKAILADELNKLLSNSLQKYISENNLEILGNPLPKAEEQPKDFDVVQDFEFLYELGLAPQFAVDISKKHTYNYETIKIDDALLSKYTEDIRKRYGNIQNPEQIEDQDLVVCDFVELDANNEILAGGIFKTSSIATDRIINPTIKAKFIGLKKDDKVVANVRDLSNNTTDISAMLGIDKAKAENINANFQLTIKNIGRVFPADANQELFDKLYGPGAVTSVEEFHNKIREELALTFIEDSDRKLKNDIAEDLLSKLNINLPDEFLKRWLMTVNEKPLTYEQVSKEYDMYSKSLKWQLIENKILKDFQIKVSTDEATDYVKGAVRAQLAKMGHLGMGDEEIDNTAKRVLENEEEVKRVFDKLYNDKVLKLFKESFTIVNKEVSYEDFYKLDKK
ncbi:MAG: trigger factor [Bacteroidetes bacterium]|nr:trigger factor [Bacteroidota bacterium]